MMEDAAGNVHRIQRKKEKDPLQPTQERNPKSKGDPTVPSTEWATTAIMNRKYRTPTTLRLPPRLLKD